MVFSLDQIIELIIAWKYFFIFIAAIIEGPIVTVISGFLSAHGYLNAFLVYPTVVVGDLVADSAYYALGRWGKASVIDRWGKYVGISSKKIIALESHFVKHGGKSVIVGKLAHGIGVLVLAAAGASKMPYKKFLTFSLLGIFPQSLILLLIGYYFGDAYKKISQYLDNTAWIMVGVALILVAVYTAIVRFSRKIEEEEEEEKL